MPVIVDECRVQNFSSPLSLTCYAYDKCQYSLTSCQTNKQSRMRELKVREIRDSKSKRGFLNWSTLNVTRLVISSMQCEHRSWLIFQTLGRKVVISLIDFWYLLIIEPFVFKIETDFEFIKKMVNLNHVHVTVSTFNRHHPLYNYCYSSFNFVTLYLLWLQGSWRFCHFDTYRFINCFYYQSIFQHSTISCSLNVLYCMLKMQNHLIVYKWNT